MDLCDFWLIIESIRVRTTDDEAFREQLVRDLSARDKSELLDFQHHFAEQMARADNWPLYDAFFLINGIGSADAFSGELRRTWMNFVQHHNGPIYGTMTERYKHPLVRAKLIDRGLATSQLSC